MTTSATIESLLAASRAGDFESIARLPGAGSQAAVVAFSSRLRGEIVQRIASMPVHDRIAFAKAVAAYEDTVGGIGSVTALAHVLPLVPDQGREALDWILAHTRSYSYYSLGATSFAELQAASENLARAQRERKSSNARKERERAELARTKRAERATANLCDAVRRGDTKAILALIRDGASPDTTAPDGRSLVEYAVSIGRADLAELLRAQSASPDNSAER